MRKAIDSKHMYSQANKKFNHEMILTLKRIYQNKNLILKTWEKSKTILFLLQLPA